MNSLYRTKKLLILLLCFYGVVGCVNQNIKKDDKITAYSTGSSPYKLTLNREIHYQSDDVDTSSFSLNNAVKTESKADTKTSKSKSLPIANIISHGYKLLGKPYRYGGQSVKTGFDCSGFVGYLFRQEAGISLPRTTRQMINVKAPTVTRANLKPGDVLFFATNRGRQVSHTGIYIGNQKFIHSANQRKGVRIDSLSNNYWSASYLKAKRILN